MSLLLLPPTPSIFANAILYICTALGGAVGGLATAWVGSWYNRKRLKLEEVKLNHQIDMDDNVLLRKDLLAERKVLLDQLISERKFYTERLNKVEELATNRINEMLRRIENLEKENTQKDFKILEQQKKIDEQELQLHSQKSLIDVLRGQVDKLSEVRECKYDPQIECRLEP